MTRPPKRKRRSSFQKRGLPALKLPECVVQSYSGYVSYDLQLFRAVEGEPIELALARLDAAAPSDDPNPGPMVPDVEEAKSRLAVALIRHVPSLEPFVFDHQQIAVLENVDQAEARRKWRHIELNEDGFGLQIMLFDKTASAALPYWHEGQKAEAAFRALWQCLDVLQKEAGYFIHDPQLDRVLDLSSESDFSAVLKRYLLVKHSVEHTLRVDAVQKPWWKFW